MLGFVLGFGSWVLRFCLGFWGFGFISSGLMV